MKEGDCPSVVRRLADEGGQPDQVKLLRLKKSRPFFDSPAKSQVGGLNFNPQAEILLASLRYNI